MTKQRKESIEECIKMMCDTKIVDVDYDEITVDFKLIRNNVFGNQTYITEYLMIASKDKEICFFASGDVDTEVICQQALLGYLRQKQKHIEKKENERRKNDYKKKHPILSFFK